MVMVSRSGTIEFIVLVVIPEVQLSQYPHLRHQLQGTIHRRDADMSFIFLQHDMQGFTAKVLSQGQILKNVRIFSR